MITILLENRQAEGFLARVLGTPNCQAWGNTRQTALDNLQQQLIQHLSHAEIVLNVVESPYANHPWLKVSGMFKDDAQFEQMLAYIEADRHQLDVEIEERHHELSTDNSAA